MFMCKYVCVYVFVHECMSKYVPVLVYMYTWRNAFMYLEGIVGVCVCLSAWNGVYLCIPNVFTYVCVYLLIS